MTNRIFDKDKDSFLVLTRYCDNAGFNIDNLTDVEVEKIFRLVKSDFFACQIGLDDMAVFMGKLWYLLSTAYRKSPTGELIKDIGELDWLIRNDPVEAAKLIIQLKEHV